MTRDAIREGFDHLRDGAEMAPLEAAARSRSEADWLVGMNGTRAATKVGRLDGVVSLGRVQTPTLALIVRRDLEIDAFVPETYFQVDARFELDEEPHLRRPLVRGQRGPDAGARAGRGGRRGGRRAPRDRRLGQAQGAQGALAAALRPDQPAARGQPPVRHVRRPHAGRRPAAVRGLGARRRHHLPANAQPVPALRPDPDAQADRRQGWPASPPTGRTPSTSPRWTCCRWRASSTTARSTTTTRSSPPASCRAASCRGDDAPHLRPGRPPLPGGLPSRRPVRGHRRRHRGRRPELPHQGQAAARGRLARAGVRRRGQRAAREARGRGRARAGAAADRRGRDRQLRRGDGAREADQAAGPLHARARCWARWRPPAARSTTRSCARR